MSFKRYQPWWNRPLWGQYTMVEKVYGFIRRFLPERVPEQVCVEHDQALRKLDVLGKQLSRIDDEKFSNKDFLFFIRMHYDIVRGDDEYKGLDDKVQLLKAAIEAKNKFTAIESTEYMHHGTKQIEYYQFVTELLKRNLERTAFQDQIHTKLDEISPELKTEEGKTALKLYAKDLTTLSDTPLGLRLLSDFKRYNFHDYAILQTVSDTITNVSQGDLKDYKQMVVRVIRNQETFQKLSKVLGVAESQDIPGTYARILQYLGLNHKHKAAYPKFQNMIDILKQWYPQYQFLMKIREEYAPPLYIQPKTFRQKLSGVDVYKKYQDFLDAG
jgi:hypothetical protein